MCSLNAKVDPFDDHISHAMSLSAFNAAIEEYNNGDNGSGWWQLIYICLQFQYDTWFL